MAQFEHLAEHADSPITALRRIPAHPAQTVPLPDHVPPALAKVLRARGIAQLYTRQADAFTAITAGSSVVIVTPTASGKTLCYNLPVLQHLLDNPGGRALYLFPTKALAEDQLHEFNSIVDDMIVDNKPSDIRAFTYDGDTPQDARRAIREQIGRASCRERV